MSLRRQGSAGGHARDRYKRGLKRWRRKVRWLFWSVSVPLFVLGTAALFVSYDVVAWFGGAIAGLGISSWAWLRDSPPNYVENWNTGFEGERKTARALRSLEGLGWYVSHDIQTGYGNYDHVVVGPGGVFLLETKYLSGVVTMRDGVPWVQQKLYPDRSKAYVDIRRQALGNAARLKGEIEERSGYGTWVQAVVVFWSDFPESIYEDEHCLFIHGSQLAELLEHRPGKLDMNSVEQIGDAIRVLATEEGNRAGVLVGV